jgi:hypothetical protein
VSEAATEYATTASLGPLMRWCSKMMEQENETTKEGDRRREKIRQQ